MLYVTAEGFRYVAIGLRKDLLPGVRRRRWERFWPQTIFGDEVYFTEHFSCFEDCREFLIRYHEEVDDCYDKVLIKKVIFFRPAY